MPLSRLTLRLRHRTGRDQTYFDFEVDGKSLFDRLDPGDLVSCLGWPHLEFEREMAARLLLDAPSNLASDRVELYVCGECADIGCGAITARITLLDDDVVQWSDIGYENDYDPTLPDLEPYVSIGPFTFEGDQYRQAIEASWSKAGSN